MFTGIVESLGKIVKVQSKGNNRIFVVQSGFAAQVKVSDSIAINGCCLTVIKKDKDIFSVEAVAETLKTTNFNRVRTGDLINLERSRLVGERLDGHIVQGHIDQVSKITDISKTPGWVAIEIELSKKNIINIVEKGSIAVDGISLTIAKIKGQKCSTNIIPYTFEHTNLKYKRIGDWVNIEFDVVGKYVRQYLSERNTR